MTEDEMLGWHHRLNGHELEQALEAGDGQGGLVCCLLWHHEELDMTERLTLCSVSSVLKYLVLNC